MIIENNIEIVLYINLVHIEMFYHIQHILIHFNFINSTLKVTVMYITFDSEKLILLDVNVLVHDWKFKVLQHFINLINFIVI